LRAKVSELESKKESKKGEQVRDIAIALAFTAGPFGFGVPILYACICWAVAWIAFIHLIWSLEHSSAVSNTRKSLTAFVASALTVWFTFAPIRAAYIREKARATSGDLIAIDDGSDHSSDIPVLQIGPTGGSRFAWSGPQDVSMIGAYYDKINLKMVKGRVYLSTTVRDQNKNLIVEIIDNHWIVSSSTAVCWDKNYSRDSLEVKDGHGRVVLQVKVMPNTVALQTEWEWDLGTKSGGIFEHGKYDEKTDIKPMFKYSSELHWGELVPGPY
jgi:hypothetical protein